MLENVYDDDSHIYSLPHREVIKLPNGPLITDYYTMADVGARLCVVINGKRRMIDSGETRGNMMLSLEKMRRVENEEINALPMKDAIDTRGMEFPENEQVDDETPIPTEEDEPDEP